MNKFDQKFDFTLEDRRVAGHTEPRIMPVVIVQPEHTWRYVLIRAVVWFVIWTAPLAWAAQALLLPLFGIHLGYWEALGGVLVFRALTSHTPYYQAFGEGTVRGKRVFR